MLSEADIIASAKISHANSAQLIGDDCAVLPLDDKRDLLVTTDALYEGVHFLRAAITPAQLAYKALAVNLSDLAAMGCDAKGASAFLILCLPPDIGADWLADFWQGWQGLAEQTGVTLAGGDTTRAAGPMVISITLITPCLKTQVKQRSAAQPGDVLAVTGALGDSLAGLQTLLSSSRDLRGDPERHHEIGSPSLRLEDDKALYLISRHHTPPIRLAAAAWLGAQNSVHGMMDLSDGLARDLPKLCAAANCGAVLMLEQLPISVELQSYANTQQISAVDLAYSGGEDYELLLTVAPDSWPYLQQKFHSQFPDTPLIAIGQITNGATIELIKQGLSYQPSDYGFEHFTQ